MTCPDHNGDTGACQGAVQERPWAAYADVRGPACDRHYDLRLTGSMGVARAAERIRRIRATDWGRLP